MLPIRRMGPVVKLGDGNLGGKARTLPFLQRLLDASGLHEEFAPHTISVPETWVITTQVFREFVARNRLGSAADLEDDREVRRRFLAASLTTSVKDSLQLFLESHRLPLAVRSSALSEDAHHHATAGLFETYFVPNRGPERLRQLIQAIKLVFASAYFQDVSRYMKSHSIPREDEEMAVALETVVGSVRGDMYYPIVSGVGQSVNYFPVGQMNPEDGVATMVMGLGSRAVDGQDGMRFCPRYPMLRPQFQQPEDIIRVSQTELDAVNLTADHVQLTGEANETLCSIPVEATEAHGTLEEVASVYDEDTGIFYDNLFRKGRRVLTFNRLLRESSFPLPTMLTRLFQITSDGFGCPVELEFAIDWKRGQGKPRCNLMLLQARPMPEMRHEAEVDLPMDLPEERVLLRTDTVLGHGGTDHLRHILFVDPDLFSLETSDAIAAEVSSENERLRSEQIPYVLLGPGRWGSCNKAAGVPVRFGQIDQALLIAEIATRRLAVEPSQGTHFFHNMVQKELFFFTVDLRKGHRLHLDWLREQPDCGGHRYIKLIEVPGEVSVRANAQRRIGLVYLSA